MPRGQQAAALLAQAAASNLGVNCSGCTSRAAEPHPALPPDVGEFDSHSATGSSATGHSHPQTASRGGGAAPGPALAATAGHSSGSVPTPANGKAAGSVASASLPSSSHSSNSHAAPANGHMAGSAAGHKYGPTSGSAGPPTHFQVDHTFEVRGVGPVLSGTVVSGSVALGQELLLGPDADGRFTAVEVTCIQRSQVRLRWGRPSESRVMVCRHAVWYQCGCTTIPVQWRSAAAELLSILPVL